MKYYVYILKSSIKERYYIGCTSNILKRLEEHNLGKTKSTKFYRPWKLVYKEEFDDKKIAYKREWHLKHPKGYLEKLEIIKNFGGIA
ncbi:MAG: GIY-YIG nuclease family protein [Patescibacteria group bacterium]